MDYEEEDVFMWDSTVPLYQFNKTVEQPIIEINYEDIPDEFKQKLYRAFVPNEYCPTPLLKDVRPDCTISSLNFLALKNEHPLDKTICKVEEPHKYFINGSCEHIMSCTEFTHLFFEPFKEQEIALSIVNSKSFVTRKNQPSYDYRGCHTLTDVLNVWKEARDLGTYLHDNIDKFLNGESSEIHPKNDYSFKMFKELHENKFWWNFTIFRTEWSIYDKDTMISGQLDAIGKLNNTYEDEYIIIDWKRNKSIDARSFARMRGAKEYPTGYGPCSKIEDCKLMVHTIQLNVYKYILEKNYGLKIKKLMLVRFHPNCSKKPFNGYPEVIPVEDVQPVVREMMAWRKCVLTHNLQNKS